MRREVYWLQRAAEQLAQLSAREAKQATRILIATREFGQASRGDVKKLSGNPNWRLRVGNWRVIYRPAGEEVYILELSDRQDAYP